MFIIWLPYIFMNILILDTPLSKYHNIIILTLCNTVIILQNNH